MADTEWHLFVDESGKFEDEAGNIGKKRERVLIAGLLLRQDLATHAYLLKEAIASQLDYIPWPLHASRTRVPVMHVLWSDWRKHDHSAKDILLPWAAQATDLFEERCPDLLEKARASLKQRPDKGKRREPEWEDIKIMDALLQKEAPYVHRMLAYRAASVRGLISGEIQRFGLNQKARSGALLFTAGEAELGDAVPGSSDRTDRYRTLLTFLLERIVAVLLQPTNDNTSTHRIAVRVLTRHVTQTGWKKGCKLQPPHLADLATSVTGSSSRTKTQGSCAVTLLPWETPDFDENAHPGLVMADYLSNDLRHFHDAKTGIKQLLKTGHDRTGLQYESGDPALPHPVASGAAADFLAAARAANQCQPPSSLPDPHVLLSRPGIHRWAANQAICWMHAVR